VIYRENRPTFNEQLNEIDKRAAGDSRTTLDSILNQYMAK